METTVIPFRGLRYNPTQVEGLANVIAPPYDVIKPRRTGRFRSTSPC